MYSIEALHEYVDHSMTNHAPKNDDVVARFEALRTFAKNLGHAVIDLCPENHHRDMAVQQVEVALMWATKSIACDQESLPELPLPQVADSISFDPEAPEPDEDEPGPFQDGEDLEHAAELALGPRREEPPGLDLSKRLGEDAAFDVEGNEAPMRVVDVDDEAADG